MGFLGFRAPIIAEESKLLDFSLSVVRVGGPGSRG